MQCNHNLDIVRGSALLRVGERRRVATVEVNEEEFLYELLRGLGVDVDELRKINPTGKQLEALYMGLNRLIENWTISRQQS